MNNLADNGGSKALFQMDSWVPKISFFLKSISKFRFQSLDSKVWKLQLSAYLAIRIAWTPNFEAQNVNFCVNSYAFIAYKLETV